MTSSPIGPRLVGPCLVLNWLLLATALPAHALVEGSPGPLLKQGLDRQADVYIDVRNPGETIRFCSSDEGVIEETQAADPDTRRQGEEFLLQRPSAPGCARDADCPAGEKCRDWYTGLAAPLEDGICVIPFTLGAGLGFCDERSGAGNWLSYVANEVGAYRIDFAGETDIMANQVNAPNTRFWAIQVLTPQNADAPGGRVHSDFWMFNSHTFSGNPTSADFYALVPSGGTGNFVFVIDFEKMNGFIYQIFANSLGNEDTPSRSWCQYGDPVNLVCGEKSDLNQTRSILAEYQIYLNYPEGVEQPLVAPQLTGFQFNDSVGTRTISPNGDKKQDVGTFTYTTNVGGTYRIIIDSNQDGVFDSSKDVLLVGTALAGDNSVEWNGLGTKGLPLPNGEYRVELSLSVGETHFPMIDIEDNAEGLMIWQASGPGMGGLSSVVMYWDDTPVGGTTNLPLGSGEPHKWLYDAANPTVGVGGNLMSMDTWVRGAATAVTKFRCRQCTSEQDHLILNSAGDDEPDQPIQPEPDTGVGDDPTGKDRRDGGTSGQPDGGTTGTPGTDDDQAGVVRSENCSCHAPGDGPSLGSLAGLIMLGLALSLLRRR